MYEAQQRSLACPPKYAILSKGPFMGFGPFVLSRFGGGGRGAEHNTHHSGVLQGSYVFRTSLMI